MTDETARAILKWCETSGGDPITNFACKGEDCFVMSDLQRMARLWLMRDEIIEGLGIGESQCLSEGFDDDATVLTLALTKIEQLGE